MTEQSQSRHDQDGRTSEKNGHMYGTKRWIRKTAEECTRTSRSRHVARKSRRIVAALHHRRRPPVFRGDKKQSVLGDARGGG